LVLKGIDNKNAGAYRTKNVGVVKSDGEIHSFTEPLKIEEEMNAFIEWLCSQTIEDPILLAALVVLQNGYPQAIIKVTNIPEYIQAVENISRAVTMNIMIFTK
jgi:hypothetical protein